MLCYIKKIIAIIFFGEIDVNLFYNNLIFYIAHPILGLCLSIGLTNLAMILLPRFGMVDAPRGRHLHEKTVPCGGGVAIWFAFFITISSLFCFARFSNAAWLMEIQSFLRYFSLPALIMLIVGVTDDRFELRSVVKLLFQIVVGLIFYYENCGITMLFGHTLPSVLSLIFTVIWCVMIINAFNLIDGLDGLAAGLGAISSLLLAGWSLISGTNEAMVMLLVCFAM